MVRATAMFDILIYRMFRLRRQILLVAVPPLTLMSLLAILELPASLFDTPAGGAAMILWIICVLGHAVVFPNAWMEALALSATACAMVLSEPILQVLLSGLADRPVQSALVLALFGLLSVLFLCGALLGVCALVETRKTRTYVGRESRTVALPPDALFDARALAPNQSSPRKTTGAADEAGDFDVVLHRTQSCPETFTSTPFDIALRARILPSEPGTHHVAICEGKEVDQLDSLSVLRLTPVQGGTCVEIGETCTRFSTTMLLGFWMQDYMADYLTHELDLLHGRASRAVTDGSQNTLLSSIARVMTATKTS